MIKIVSFIIFIANLNLLDIIFMLCNMYKNNKPINQNANDVIHYYFPIGYLLHFPIPLQLSQNIPSTAGTIRRAFRHIRPHFRRVLSRCLRL